MTTIDLTLLRSPRNISVHGDLLRRLHANFDRLERADYTPEQVIASNVADEWPGDTPGRTMLAWANLGRATGREPRYMQALFQALPQHFNELGYMGPVFTSLDEQQLSGHGWLTSGLLAYHEYTGSQAALDYAQRIVDNLFLKMRGRMASYPRQGKERSLEGLPAGTRASTLNNWTLSTDIGCAFVSLEGLVKAYKVFRRPTEKDLIEEMLDIFQSINLEAVSAQLHASLTAARQFLMYHDLSADSLALETAKKVYLLFRQRAITENYANYNWFNRPSWTEPCAVVDALSVAFELWRKTADPAYLEDAHHIYYNALGYGQKPHGGFGCDNCAGTDTPLLYNRVFDVTWCCNMRGAIGLSQALQYTWQYALEAIFLPFYFDSTVELVFPDGILILELSTTYPHEGHTLIKVFLSTLKEKKDLHFYVPSWVNEEAIQVRLNHHPVSFHVANGFAVIDQLSIHSGDYIELHFPIYLRKQPIINPSHLAGYTSYRHGPLILSRRLQTSEHQDQLNLLALESGAEELEPVCSIFDYPAAVAQVDRRQILFK